MKFDKLMDIWKGMKNDMIDREELLNLLQFFDRYIRREGIDFYLKKPADETGMLVIKAGDDQENSLLCEVKIWDNKEKEIHTNNSLRRRVTSGDGCLAEKLPVGEYRITVSKGPEYSVSETDVLIEEGRKVQVNPRLVRIAHFTDRGWYAGDLHHHSIYSSPVYGGTDPVIETPAQVKASMKAMGMNFGALSDHHNTLNHEIWSSLKDDSFIPVISKEISTSNGHVLQLGVDKDVIYDIPQGTDRTDERLIAEFKRITGDIKEQGGLPQLNHPFDLSRSTSFNPAGWSEVDMFESFEIWNGATPFIPDFCNYKSFEKWLELMDAGVYLSGTAGSDTHNIFGDDYFGMIEWLEWLKSGMDRCADGMTAEIRAQADILSDLYDRLFVPLRKWVEAGNTPCNVRNYVNVGNDNADSSMILESIRRGKMFVSNGPLLEITVEGAGFGEYAELKGNMGLLKAVITSPEPVDTITIYLGRNRTIEEILPEPELKAGSYIYRLEKNVSFKDAKWAVFTAGSMPNNLAISDPVYFSRK